MNIQYSKDIAWNLLKDFYNEDAEKIQPFTI